MVKSSICTLSEQRLTHRQIKSTKNKNACMKRVMPVEEAQEVYQERTEWRSLPTPVVDRRGDIMMMMIPTDIFSLPLVHLTLFIKTVQNSFK